MSGRQMVEHVEKLGMIVRESHPFGDVLGHDAAHAVLMTWYRNNASHAFALPSLIACLLVNRRRRIRLSQLMQMVTAVYPYLQSELYLDSMDLDVEVSHWLDHLATQGLIRRSDDEVGPPPVESNESYRLMLLAQIVMQNLAKKPSDINLHIAATEANLELGDALARTGRAADARAAWSRGLAAIDSLARTRHLIDHMALQAAALMRLDRVDEARPLVADLVQRGYRRPRWIAIARAKHLLPAS